jgi:uncharacterized membrane protein YecN with MAPEG domain
MATSLTFTSAAFAQNTAFAASALTETVILAADALNTRRIYGISFTNSGAQIPVVTLRIKDGSSVAAGVFTVTTTTGANVMTDIFGNTNGAPIFQKKRDANGNAYYDIPATYTVTAQLSLNGTSSCTILVFGETYA